MQSLYEKDKVIAVQYHLAKEGLNRYTSDAARRAPELRP